jgi:hypothetical protein
MWFGRSETPNPVIIIRVLIAADWVRLARFIPSPLSHDRALSHTLNAIPSYVLPLLSTARPGGRSPSILFAVRRRHGVSDASRDGMPLPWQLLLDAAKRVDNAGGYSSQYRQR